MRTQAFAPLYRSSVGFDRLASILEAASKAPASEGFPPYNIERTGEHAYRITLAVAGFEQSELSLETNEGVLSVKGERAEKADAEGTKVLYRGIAGRAFERRFQLADHVEVKGASLKNGLLHVELARVVPEALKLRRIDIAVAGNTNVAVPDEAEAA